MSMSKDKAMQPMLDGQPDEEPEPHPQWCAFEHFDPNDWNKCTLTGDANVAARSGFIILTLGDKSAVYVNMNTIKCVTPDAHESQHGVFTEIAYESGAVLVMEPPDVVMRLAHRVKTLEI